MAENEANSVLPGTCDTSGSTKTIVFRLVTECFFCSTLLLFVHVPSRVVLSMHATIFEKKMVDTLETEPFSDLLRYFRTNKKLTQEQLAQRVGVHRNTISAWENDDYVPKDIDEINRLEEKLDLSHLQTDMLFIAAHYPPKYQKLNTERILPIDVPLASSRVSGSAKPLKPTDILRNPYKGLHAFGLKDVGDFFGRDRLVDELVEALLPTSSETDGGQGTRLLTVIGPSGAGKTSVMMAGLLPRLQAGAVPGSQLWLYVQPIVLGKKPLESLALALSEHLPEKRRDLIEQDLSDPSARGLSLLTESLAKRGGTRVVLVIDQFEELYKQSLSQVDVKHLVKLFVSAVTEPQSALLVLITLRADFYTQIMSSPEFAQLVRVHQRLVLPMTKEEFRAVIEEPAKLPDVKLKFEKTLVDDLLSEIQEQAGALPLLEFTLYQLVDQSKNRLGKDRRLTLQVYREIGGVKGALASYAEAVYTTLPPEKQSPFVRYVFLRLVLIEGGDRRLDVVTRRRASLQEFILSDPLKTEAVTDVISLFITARLLVTDRIAEVPTLEVSHEALLLEWPRLKEWLRETREEDIRLQQRISQDATEWEDSGKSKDRLYRGTQRRKARTWAVRNMPSANEMAFLQASAKRHIQSVISVVVLVLVLVSSISAAGWYGLHQPPDPTRVTTLADNGIGSLRWCIDNVPSGRTIRFDESVRGTIRLTSGDLAFVGGKKLIINGPGAKILAISSGHTNSGINIFRTASVTISGLSFKDSRFTDKSLIENGGTLKLTGFTFSHNSTNVYGGDIYNTGVVSLDASALSGNTASLGGGGIYNATGGTVSLINSSLSANITEYGGGIYNATGGTVSLINSSLSSNLASYGGGIFNHEGGKVSVIDSTFSGNQTFYGGGIFNIGTVSLLGSTLSKNAASIGGGGIYNNTGIVSLNNSTLFANIAKSNSGITTYSYMVSLNDSTLASGGGIDNEGGRIDITFCTIASNTASQGGGIFLHDFEGISGGGIISRSEATIRNSIIAANQANTGRDISGSFISGGYNLIQNAIGATFTPNRGDQLVPDFSHVFASNVGLSSNGGSTQTLVLLADLNNPALDVIPLAFCQVKEVYDEHARMYTDQRGKLRPGNKKTACDIGAYEAQNVIA